jgi:hypothetical protein
MLKKITEFPRKVADNMWEIAEGFVINITHFTNAQLDEVFKCKKR